MVFCGVTDWACESEILVRRFGLSAYQTALPEGQKGPGRAAPGSGRSNRTTQTEGRRQATYIPTSMLWGQTFECRSVTATPKPRCKILWPYVEHSLGPRTASRLTRA